MTLLILATITAAGCDDDAWDDPWYSRQPVIINVVEDLRVKRDGISDDEPALQLALNFAAAQGGGTVYMPAGTYGIARPLILRSGVNLVGDGMGSTIVRPLGSHMARIIDTDVYAAIAMVAADNASVSNLTVDLSYADTQGNGVSILPTGRFFEGTPSSNCTISQVEVIGGGNHHAYMIWNLRGRNIRILYNVVDGRVDSAVTSNQEGIESYGGHDVLVGWNTIRNIGNTALNFGSAGHPDTEVNRLTVRDNIVVNSGRGLNIGSWLGTEAQDVKNVVIEGNTFSDLWQTGMYISVQPGTEIDNLLITGNTIRNIGTDSSVGAVGIHFQAPPPTAVPSFLATGNIVQRNEISDVRGTNSYAFVVNYFPGVSILDNTIRDIGYNGIQSFDAKDLIVEGNLLAEIGRIAVASYGPGSSAFVRRNALSNWASANSVAGVLFDGPSSGEIMDNHFSSEYPTGSAVFVTSRSSNVVVFRNDLDRPISGVAEPFVNRGTGSNLGTFIVPPATSMLTINHELVTENSALIVEQTTGATLTFSATPADGSILLQFDPTALGGERFRYEIDPGT